MPCIGDKLDGASPLWGYVIANLVRLGINIYKAWEYANTRKGYWHIANSWILSTTITNERLAKAGYVSMANLYLNARKLT